jgi:hypothetical protein
MTRGVANKIVVTSEQAADWEKPSGGPNAAHSGVQQSAAPPVALFHVLGQPLHHPRRSFAIPKAPPKAQPSGGNEPGNFPPK